MGRVRGLESGRGETQAAGAVPPDRNQLRGVPEREAAEDRVRSHQSAVYLIYLIYLICLSI